MKRYLWDFITAFDELAVVLERPSSDWRLYGRLIDTIMHTASLVQIDDVQAHAVRSYLADRSIMMRHRFQQAIFMFERLCAEDYIRDRVELKEIVSHRYRTLVSHELAFLREHIDSGKGHLLFIGTSPFPISAIIYCSLYPNLTVDIIEVSREQVEVTREVVHRAGVGRQVRILQEGDRPTDDIYSCILMPPTLGISEKEKFHFLKILCSTVPPGVLFLIRSASRSLVSTCLYAPFPEREVRESLDDIFLLNSHDEVPISSSLFMKL